MADRFHFIHFVRDQRASTEFFRFVLGLEPQLEVSGMTEFLIAPNTVLGLMPDAGAQRLFPDSGLQCASPPHQLRSELYCVCADAAERHQRALAAGARELSPMALRSWGEFAAYSVDPDGYVLAFALPD